MTGVQDSPSLSREGIKGWVRASARPKDSSAVQRERAAGIEPPPRSPTPGPWGAAEARSGGTSQAPQLEREGR